MAKKKNELKNYVTRDTNGDICLWLEVNGKLLISHHGEWLIQGSCTKHKVLPSSIYKAFIGNLPRTGMCREFNRGGK